MNRAVSRNRLLTLASFLEALPNRRFDFSVLVDGETWKGKEDLSCGTTACAMGWAPTIPAFRKAGLSMKARPYNDERWNPDTQAWDKVTKYEPRFQYEKRDGQSFDDTDAIREFFGLSRDEEDFLFYPDVAFDGVRSPDTGATAKAVAKHIRKFVEKHRS